MHSHYSAAVAERFFLLLLLWRTDPYRHSLQPGPGAAGSRRDRTGSNRDRFDLPSPFHRSLNSNSLPRYGTARSDCSHAHAAHKLCGNSPWPRYCRPIRHRRLLKRRRPQRTRDHAVWLVYKRGRRPRSPGLLSSSVPWHTKPRPPPFVEPGLPRVAPADRNTDFASLTEARQQQMRPPTPGKDVSAEVRAASHPVREAHSNLDSRRPFQNRRLPRNGLPMLLLAASRCATLQDSAR